MNAQLFRNWWLYLVRAILAIVFGILVITWPGTAKIAIVLLFGAFALTDGVFAVTTSIVFHGYFERWWAMLLEGLTGITFGVLTFLWPGITALVLLVFIAAWAVITGIFEIVAAIHFRRLIAGGWLMSLSGLLSMALGVLLVVFPATGGVALVWLVGIYAITAGIFEMVFAFHLRGLRRDFAHIIAPDGLA